MNFFFFICLFLKDKYVLLSMVMLCVVCAWHAIIAVCPSDVAPYWDYLAFLILAILYALFHLIFFLWMYFVTYRRRRLMKRKDKEYLKNRFELFSTYGFSSSDDPHDYISSSTATVLRRATITTKPPEHFINNSNKQQNSTGDAEAVTMRQFRIGSLAC